MLKNHPRCPNVKPSGIATSTERKRTPFLARLLVELPKPEGNAEGGRREAGYAPDSTCSIKNPARRIVRRDLRLSAFKRLKLRAPCPIYRSTQSLAFNALDCVFVSLATALVHHLSTSETMIVQYLKEVAMRIIIDCVRAFLAERVLTGRVSKRAQVATRYVHLRA